MGTSNLFIFMPKFVNSQSQEHIHTSSKRDYNSALAIVKINKTVTYCL